MSAESILSTMQSLGCPTCGTSMEVRSDAIGRTRTVCPACRPRSQAAGYHHPDDAFVPQTLVRARAERSWDNRSVSVGAMVKAARVAAGLSQTELAKRSGLAGGSSITQIERDYQQGHNTQSLGRIAEALGCRLVLVFERGAA